MKKLIPVIMFLAGATFIIPQTPPAPQQSWGDAPTPPPWVQPSNDASKLPSKDKEKLQILLDFPGKMETLTKNYRNRIIKDDEYRAELAKEEKKFLATVADLKKQIDGVKLSLSGIISSLSWQKRVNALGDSLKYILNRARIAEVHAGLQQVNSRTKEIETLIDQAVKKLTS